MYNNYDIVEPCTFLPIYHTYTPTHKHIILSQQFYSSLGTQKMEGSHGVGSAGETEHALHRYDR